MIALPVMKKTPNFTLLLLLLTGVIAACTANSADNSMRIVLIADGRQRAYVHDRQISVGQFLEQVDVTIGEMDRVVPPQMTQISDGMTITVVRIQEETECVQNSISFQERTIPNEGLEPGETRLAQAGVNGIEEVCYRITIQDGERRDPPVEIRRVVLEAPQDKIIWVGIDTTELEAVQILGTIAYISNGNAWIMSGSSTTKRPLTDSGALDGKVFALSSDGNQILYTQRYSGNETDVYFNTLWVILDTRSATPSPYELDLLDNILYADWVTGEPFTFSYSTAEARDTAPGWQAFNDLWLIQVDQYNARLISPRNIVESSSGGVYGWWGTRYKWSPDGQALAWARANGIGLVDLETGEFSSLLDFPVYTTFQDWVWQPNLSWSPDNQILVTTVHGSPFGAEQPESSPIFDVTATTVDSENGYQAVLMNRAGIWASPEFSPFVEYDGEFPRGFLAYLQARNPLNSINDEYDLVVSDRDGSNPRTVFPPADQDGIEAREIEQLSWSPDGQQIALIYQGNLWVVDANSGRAQQLTIDGGASSPRWTS